MGADEIALSVEASNQLRAKLGLPLLRLDSNNDDDGHVKRPASSAAVSVFTTPSDVAAAAAGQRDADAQTAVARAERQQQRADRIAAAIAQRQADAKHAFTAGPTLADADSDEDGEDNAAFVAKLQAKLAAAPPPASPSAPGTGASQPSHPSHASRISHEEDAAELVVHGDLDAITAHDQILTLKDMDVLENEEEGDVLESIAEVEAARAAQAIATRKQVLAGARRSGNLASAIEELEHAASGTPKGRRPLLSQYDDVAERAPSAFRIKVAQPHLAPAAAAASTAASAAHPLAAVRGRTSSASAVTPAHAVRDMDVPTLSASNRHATGRDDDDDDDALGAVKSTPMAVDGEVKPVFKAKKAKKRLKAFKRKPLEPDAEAALDARMADSNALRGGGSDGAVGDEQGIDDDALQLSLAQARKRALNQRMRATLPAAAADVAAQLASKAAEPEADAALSGGVAYSEAHELVGGLAFHGTDPRDTGETASPPGVMPVVKRSTTPTTTPPPLVVKHEPLDDEAMTDAKPVLAPVSAAGASPIAHPSPAAAADAVMVKQERADELEEGEVPDRFEEPLVSSGVGATLALLRQKGLLKTKTDEERRAEQLARERELWLNQKKRDDLLRAAAREQQRLATRGSNRESGIAPDPHRHPRNDDDGRDHGRADMPSARSERAEERAQLAATLERFKNYQPTVHLEYRDAYGYSLGPKDAFRQLAHAFHGIKPSKAKVDKMLRKREAEAQQQGLGVDGDLNPVVATLQKHTQAAGVAGIVIGRGANNRLADTLFASARPAGSHERAPAADGTRSNEHPPASPVAPDADAAAADNVAPDADAAAKADRSAQNPAAAGFREIGSVPVLATAARRGSAPPHQDSPASPAASPAAWPAASALDASAPDPVPANDAAEAAPVTHPPKRIKIALGRHRAPRPT
ncbi:hypothetical protein CXG81DRAFT_25826 [Caulochytrium protostelioides]|uniref:SART-1 protein n=1 Tax=Caulochytrium protostelioides TaxID=1555241 RepID=A0A4P9X8A8_9FUNG|nr:hypothetical protein CXG81DRAFT_25826 [Caulochytrium protostelioides]|eukprot:RKP01498.1 hypothetical protein CXG81DRAFT_25826 [Caulochytrium protostelioides]